MVCDGCGNDFEQKSAVQRYCSPKCRYRVRDAKRDKATDARRRHDYYLRTSVVNQRRAGEYEYRGREARRTDRPCSVAGCDAEACVSRGLCMRHYRQAALAAGKDWPKHGHFKKRAARHGVEYEVINRREVFERDGWVCGICGDDVEPDDASLDHIVSMSNGGSHTYDNVQCAHTACNVRKGNRDGIAPVQSRDAALSR